MCVWKGLELTIIRIGRETGASLDKAEPVYLTGNFSADEERLNLSFQDETGEKHEYRGENHPSGHYVLLRDGFPASKCMVHHQHRQAYLEGTLLDNQGRLCAQIRLLLPPSARDHRTWVRVLSLGSVAPQMVATTRAR